MWHESATLEATPAHEMLALEHLLLGDLRELLTQKPTPQTKKYLGCVLDMLLRLLPSQFAMEEQGGYLREVTEEFPTWYEKVEALRDEHGGLYEELFALRCELNNGESQSSAERLQRRLADWMDHLAHHEEAERSIVQMASTLDIGEGE